MTAGRIPSIEGGIQPTLLSTTGDIMYASSASNPARLAIGSSAQVLTVASGIPSWATPASGGMTLLSTTTLSGTTTISSISQAYKNLVIQIYGISNATANGIFRATINSGFPVNSFAYRSQYATITTYATVTDYLQLTANVDTLRTDTANAFTITINDYANTSAATKTFTCNAGFLNSSSQLTQAFTMGQIVLGAGISAFSFSSVGGNLSTGTVLIYGVS
jgi:hypothetical protein